MPNKHDADSLMAQIEDGSFATPAAVRAEMRDEVTRLRAELDAANTEIERLRFYARQLEEFLGIPAEESKVKP
jgi:predicted nuclease with TOPRIM domain